MKTAPYKNSYTYNVKKLGAVQNLAHIDNEKQPTDTMNRRFGHNQTPGNARRGSNAQPQYNGPQLRRPDGLTFTPDQDPFPAGSHALTKAIRLLDTSDMPIHIFFILERNTSSDAAKLLRQAVATAKKRREQIGGDVFAVAKAALMSNNPALVKVMDTHWGELFVTEVGREDLVGVMFEVDPLVWRLCGVGCSISEGRVYLLRDALKEREQGR